MEKTSRMEFAAGKYLGETFAVDLIQDGIPEKFLNELVQKSGKSPNPKWIVGLASSLLCDFVAKKLDDPEALLAIEGIARIAFLKEIATAWLKAREVLVDFPVSPEQTDTVLRETVVDPLYKKLTNGLSGTGEFDRLWNRFKAKLAWGENDKGAKPEEHT